MLGFHPLSTQPLSTLGAPVVAAIFAELLTRCYPNSQNPDKPEWAASGTVKPTVKP